MLPYLSNDRMHYMVSEDTFTTIMLFFRTLVEALLQMRPSFRPKKCPTTYVGPVDIKMLNLQALTRTERCRLGPPVAGGGDFPPVPEEAEKAVCSVEGDHSELFDFVDENMLRTSSEYARIQREPLPNALPT